MPFKYRIDVLAELKKKGYNSTRIRNERIFGQRVVQQFRDGELSSWAVVDKLCTLLECNIEDIIERVDEELSEKGN